MAGSIMDWDELASSELPTLSSGRGGSSSYHPNLQLLQPRDAGHNSDPFSTSHSSQAQGSTSAAFLSSFAASPAVPQPQARHHRPLESLEEAIQRHEQKMLASIIQRCADETRQRTSAAIEAQLQSAWERDRAVWIKETVGSRFMEGADATTNTPHRSNNVGLLTASQFYPSSPNRIHPGATSSLDSAFVQSHWKVVQQMGKMPVADVVDQFSRVAIDAALPNHRSSTAIMGYSSAWQLAANLVQVPHTPVDQARAALAHFCKQFQGVVTNRVRQAALAGHDTASGHSNDLAAQCETFSRLTSGTADPWGVLYYCLRCGDAVAAVDALQRTPADLALQRILDVMAAAQGNAACVWESRNAPFRLDPSDRRVLSDLLDHAKRADSASISIHQLGVYSILSESGSQPVTSENVEGFKTIEDYLTASIWNAVLQPNPVDELIRLGELINNFGPSHFEDASSEGWSYALPLLASQQYQKALLWLADAGGSMGLLQAAHFGLILSMAGVEVRNLGHNDSAAEGTTASLLVAYAKELLAGPGSLAALDYLVLIPNAALSRKEVAKLIATTGEIDKLVGTMDAEGIRQGGAVAGRFAPEELSTILIEAAADLRAAALGDQQKTGTAVMCLMLAGRYGDVLSMLNELLSPANDADEDRKFWRGQVESFHTQYLVKRTHVLEVLEAQGKTSLIRTSRLLLDLNMFFERHRHGDPDHDCWAIADKLQLLPKSDADRRVKEIEYRENDPLIRDIYPFFLVCIMEILHSDHCRLKRELHGDASGVVRGRLKELQEMARLYTSFAASVGMANKQIGILTELSSLMI